MSQILGHGSENLSIKARLLLMSTDEGWLEQASHDFDRLGLRCLCASSFEAGEIVIQDLEIEAVLLDNSFANIDKDVVARLKSAGAPRILPICLWQRQENADRALEWSLCFDAQSHPQQIVLRIEHLIRTAVAEEEFEVRKLCFAHGSFDHTQESETQFPLTILSAGKPTPEFLAVNHALQSAGVELYAALTSYSAFDYLHDKLFDCVLLWADEQPSEALSIASGMRRNTRLYHTPVLLRLDRGVEIDLGESYLRGVNDIATKQAATQEVCERLLRLARDYRKAASIRRRLENMRHLPDVDRDTGLFGRDLFAQHLARLSTASQARNRPLSVCILKIADTADLAKARKASKLERAIPQIGSMIARLIRAEDTGGRLSPDIFALAMPATSQAQARQVGERIAAVVGCTAFDSDVGGPPVVIEFDIGVAQIQFDEPPAQALLRAAANIRQTSENGGFHAF
jgi:two-component system cell cycle response regulator PopA